MTGLDEKLGAALSVAVPLRMLDIRGWTGEQRANDAAWALELMRAGAAGDVLLYGGENGSPAAAFAALVRGLAALAYVEGGVDFAGLHWCTVAHEWCPSRRVWEHLGPYTLPDPVPRTPALRIEDASLPGEERP